MKKPAHGKDKFGASRQPNQEPAPAPRTKWEGSAGIDLWDTPETPMEKVQTELAILRRNLHRHQELALQHRQQLETNYHIRMELKSSLHAATTENTALKAEIAELKLKITVSEYFM